MNYQPIYFLLFCSGYLLLIFFCEFLHKQGVKPEITRKIAHILSTLSSLLFLQAFTQDGYVEVLAFIAFLVLFVGHQKKMFQGIDGVKRETHGSYLLPISIGIVYYISSWYDNYMFFIIPILILAISDPVASMGSKINKTRLLKTNKTIAGTILFFTSALIVSSSYLYIFQPEIKNILFIASGTAFITCIAELITPRGFDNLTIPLSAIFFLILI